MPKNRNKNCFHVLLKWPPSMAVPYESFDLLKLGLSKIKNNKNYDYEQQKNLIFQSKIE